MLGAARDARAATTYQVIDLGSLGNRTSNAVAINRFGQVTGTSRLAAGGYDAYLWQSGTNDRHRQRHHLRVRDE